MSRSSKGVMILSYDDSELIFPTSSFVPQATGSRVSWLATFCNRLDNRVSRYIPKGVTWAFGPPTEVYPTCHAEHSDDSLLSAENPRQSGSRECGLCRFLGFASATESRPSVTNNQIIEEMRPEQLLRGDGGSSAPLEPGQWRLRRTRIPESRAETPSGNRESTILDCSPTWMRCGPRREIYAVYLPIRPLCDNREHFRYQEARGDVSIKLEPGTYEGKCFSASTGDIIPLSPVQGPVWTVPKPPGWLDWALLLQRAKQ